MQLLRHNVSRATARPPHDDRASRRGIILVSFAVSLLAILALLGLVIDTGLLMAAHRQTQNAADAAALAAAMDKLLGASDGQAEATAATFVQTHNGLAEAQGPFLSFPPTRGAYIGQAATVEATVASPVNTVFMQILPGVSQTNIVRARAVATWGEAVTSGQGVVVLDPNARPGLKVSGNGRIVVDGGVFVNSEGGGVDENGDPVNNGNNGVAAQGGNANGDNGIFASRMHVVGGVDDPSAFRNVDPQGPNPLRCLQLPLADPLLNLPTPTVANGVRNIDHGSVKIGNNSVNGVLEDPSGENEYDSGTGRVTLHPGLYDDIEITGGIVDFLPGIFVLRGGKKTAFKVTGGAVTGEGVMFYNTGHNYHPDSGTPDINDHNKKPPFDDGAVVGSFIINSDMQFSPIDTNNPRFNYAGMSSIDTFNGMLFYQRRRITESLEIQGNSSQGVLTGTLYAKWALFKIAGEGTYDAQFMCGSMEVTGQGDVTLSYAGNNKGKAPQVFLVE